jgi:hypothetical protein
MCAAAEAARHSTLPSAGLVRERPRLPWRRGRVTCNGEGTHDRLALLIYCNIYFHALTALTAGAPLGLRAQLVKCTVYSEDTAAAASVAAALGMHHAPDGLLAMGTPVGTTAFEAASVATCADNACTLTDRMQALPATALPEKGVQKGGRPWVNLTYMPIHTRQAHNCQVCQLISVSHANLGSSHCPWQTRTGGCCSTAASRVG